MNICFVCKKTEYQCRCSHYETPAHSGPNGEHYVASVRIVPEEGARDFEIERLKAAADRWEEQANRWHRETRKLEAEIRTARDAALEEVLIYLKDVVATFSLAGWADRARTIEGVRCDIEKRKCSPPEPSAAEKPNAYKDGWAFAHRQWQATGSVPDPAYKQTSGLSQDKS